MNYQSDLVGKYGFFIETKKVRAAIYITGMADEHNYICQFLNAFTGVPNAARIMNIEELKKWTIVFEKELADEMFVEAGKEVGYDVFFV